MVFRRLQLGLAVAALLGAACASEGETTSASISMDIDPLSCATDAEGLFLTCASTAIVVVLDQRGNLLASDCATLPSGRLVDSASVIQNTLALGTLPGSTPLTIALSIHSGILSPCPEANASSEAFLSGITQLVTLSQESSAIALPLRCAEDVLNPDTPADPDSQDCSQCESQRQSCIFENAVDSCDSAIGNCQSQCQDTPEFEVCINTCVLIGSYCIEGNTDILCDSNQVKCLDLCQMQNPADLCGPMCADALDDCSQYAFIRQQCQSQYQSCLGACDGGGATCLALGF